MNTYSWLLFALLSVAAITGYCSLFVLCLRQNKQINALRLQMEMFADSSIQVAQSVDRLMQHGMRDNAINVASRRWILQEAKARLQQGESMIDIAVPLGLSRDEIRLLHTQMH